MLNKTVEEKIINNRQGIRHNFVRGCAFLLGYHSFLTSPALIFGVKYGND